MKLDNILKNNLRNYLLSQLSQKIFSKTIEPGISIAIGIGSRGITQIFEITEILINQLRELGAKPFIIPAMGSHEGANAQDQAVILASYGITEKELGIPV